MGDKHRYQLNIEVGQQLGHTGKDNLHRLQFISIATKQAEPNKYVKISPVMCQMPYKTYYSVIQKTFFLANLKKTKT